LKLVLYLLTVMYFSFNFNLYVCLFTTRNNKNITMLCWMTSLWKRCFLAFHLFKTSLNPVPNAQVCVYLTIHITKLQLQTTFPKPLYIPHFACIHQDPGYWKSWCLHCLWPVR
jgi:hypothetical protein